MFHASPDRVWDGFTVPNISTPTTNVLVSFLWAPSGDVPVVENILNGVPTTMTSSTITFSPAAAWTAILNDPNFTLAHNANDNSLVVTRISSGPHAINYDGVFPLLGSTANTTYTFFAIGWNGAYATPQLAAAANAAVGWSAPFTYSANAQTATPDIFRVDSFGVVGTVPESSIAMLGGLGAAVLAIYRRVCRWN